LRIPAAYRVSYRTKDELSTTENPVQWLFLDLNAFFASCEQQENPALRGKPVIVVQTPADSAVAIAASYAAKSFGIKTGTLMKDARRLCPEVIPVQANHRLYTDYHDRILTAVDTCLPSIDEMACRLMGTERQVPAARALALKVKRALRDQVGECLTCSIGIAPNVFLGKVGSDLQKPDGLVVITKDDLPDILLGLYLQHLRHRPAHGAAASLRRHPHRRPVVERDAVAAAAGVGRHQPRALPPDAARRQHPARLLAVFEKHRPPACAGAGAAHQKGAHDFAQHLLTKAAERLRRDDYYCRRLGVHLSWVADLGGWLDETDFHETRDTGFLLARLDELWQRVPRYKPLSVGVVLARPGARRPASARPVRHRHRPAPKAVAADRPHQRPLWPLRDRLRSVLTRCAGVQGPCRVSPGAGKVGVLMALIHCSIQRARNHLVPKSPSLLGHHPVPRNLRNRHPVTAELHKDLYRGGPLNRRMPSSRSSSQS
jgi:DNA polymerase-4